MVMRSVQVPPDHCQGRSAKQRRKARRRLELFAAQGGKCHWCGGDMQLNHLRVTDRPANAIAGASALGAGR